MDAYKEDIVELAGTTSRGKKPCSHREGNREVGKVATSFSGKGRACRVLVKECLLIRELLMKVDTKKFLQRRISDQPYPGSPYRRHVHN